jgi:hypothetical protein
MKKFTVVLFFLLGLGVTSAFAQKRTVAGITFPPKTTVNGKNVIYNGSGLREKYTFDLYVAALYLTRPSMDAGKIITDDTELALHIEIVSSKVTKDKFVETVKEGFGKASHGKATSDEISKFMAFFTGQFKVGDKIHLEYSPGIGVTVLKNDVKIGVMKGLEFKKALFSIWLGTSPADKNLKNGLLGKV